jgi:hypothetical protein
MNLHEPMTLATDYVLTIASAIFAARLWRVHRMWALAFLFTAAGSFFGGAYHGFVTSVTPLTAVVLWKLTVFSIGIASFFLLAGSARVLAPVAIVMLVIYTSWMIVHNDFVWVIADYGLTLVIIAIVQLVRRGPSMPWVLSSIAFSILGALVQMSRYAPHPRFNHNDLYHLIQLIALWLLYRGGKLMNRSTAPPTTQPT